MDLLLAAGGGASFAAPDPEPEPPGPGEVGVTVDETTTLVTGTISGKDWHGRAAIKRLNSGRLVMSYRDGTAHNVNDGSLHIKFSDDNGATWSAADELPDATPVDGFPMNPATLTAGQDAGEPWLYYFPETDRLVLHMWRVDYGVSNGGTWQSESEDGGATWTTSHGPIEFADPTASASTHLRTFATDDDFIDEATGDLYAVARIHTSVSAVAANQILIRTTDQGVTWERVGAATNPRIVTSSEAGGRGGIEAGMEYTGSGRIVCMIRDGFSTNSYRRISTDMGETWGTLDNMTSTVGIAARQRIYTRAHLKGEADWWDDPVLIMTGFVLQTPGQSQGRRNAVWISEDAGATWSTPFYIDTASGDGGYGDIFYDDDNDQYVVVSYRGTLTVADLKQYRLTIAGI